MRGSTKPKDGIWAPMLRVGASLVFIGAVGLGRAAAADWEPPQPATGRRLAARPPTVIQSPCRIVMMPEANLTGDTTQFLPTRVCVSRGLYADTTPPPPPLQRPWWWW
ncbi:hypothetical protein [Methylovirgula sp. HY1]|uniref:hypothetical protein n=1 Tax=Methylovirgula sp. HY1 TaxID=2822761 RepID=UPI001C5B2A7C|nr:hypothetical protein [Methylovirgula sp. HY1]QXX75405.1 hypothetical protein MHY1_02224 [Methylovirgula sp. HY1]